MKKHMHKYTQNVHFKQFKKNKYTYILIYIDMSMYRYYQ